MLTRCAAKFCVEPRSPFSNISHHDPKPLGKLLTIVSSLNVHLNFQVTAAAMSQLWTSGGALVEPAQEPDIPFGESVTSMKRGEPYEIMAGEDASKTTKIVVSCSSLSRIPGAANKLVLMVTKLVTNNVHSGGAVSH